MDLVPVFSSEFDLDKEMNSFGWITRYLPFAGGRLIAFCYSGHNNDWLVEIANGEVTKRGVPKEIVAEYYSLQRGDYERHDIYRGRICPFKCGEGFGLLLSDRVIYLFSSIHADPVAIRIENGFNKWVAKSGLSSFLPSFCGNTMDNRVPVIFDDPREPQGTTTLLSLLEIDESKKSARWIIRQKENYPKQLLYLLDHPWAAPIRLELPAGEALSGFRPLVYDFAWLGTEGLVFTTGFRSNYIRGGMDFSRLLRIDDRAQSVDVVLDIEENSFGRTCASLDKVLLTPLRKGGSRKGRQSFYCLRERAEVPVKLPRGMSKYTIVESLDQYYWLSSNNRVWQEEEPVRIVACKATL